MGTCIYSDRQGGGGGILTVTDRGVTYLGFYGTRVVNSLWGIVQPALGFVRTGIFHHFGLGGK